MSPKLQEIADLFQYLPERDKRIASIWLSRRKFVEIKEIVDSDVTLVSRQLSASIDNNGLSADEYTKSCGEKELQLNKLKELQVKVDAIAKDFIDLDSDSDDNDSDYYF